MITTEIPLYLASKSPRRKKLFKQLNLKFKVFKVDYDETVSNGDHPIKVVKNLAIGKLEEAKKKIKKGIIVTADTIVVLKKQIINKPLNNADAEKLLLKLSGKTHTVYTGFAIFHSQKNITICDYEKTFVTFRKLEINEIRDYINTGSPMDKAGAYGIQDDFGAVFVKKINGCYYNVVGFPITKFYLHLKNLI